jgi:phosphatidylinositol-3-phosphatase
MNSDRRSIHFVTRLGIAVAVALALVTLVAPRANTARADGGGNRSDLKNFQHVFIIMMENTSFTSLIGNSASAPFINFAAATYGLATDYHGVTHPSQPNYIAATSGQPGNDTDNDETLFVQNIVDQLEAAGKTWKGYMQSYSLCATKFDHACGNQQYERKHNPFISYNDVQTNPARLAKLVDFTKFATDLANNTVPDYSWISPDQCNDMHGRGGGGSGDPCDFSHVQGLIATGDAFLQSTVNAIMSSRAWTGNSVIFIAWDESDFTGSGPFGFGDTSGCCDANPGGGHVVTITISHSDHSARTSNVPYNHYSMLATIEGGWKLGCLVNTCDTKNVPPMSDLVGPKG